jgi:hypothetical protein
MWTLSFPALSHISLPDQFAGLKKGQDFPVLIE